MISPQICPLVPCARPYFSDSCSVGSSSEERQWLVACLVVRVAAVVRPRVKQRRQG